MIKQKSHSSSGTNALYFDVLLKREGLKPVYLLLGEEAYLANEVMLSIRRAAFDGFEDGPSLVKLDGKTTTIKAILNETLTVPFITCKRRVIIVDNFTAFLSPQKKTDKKDQAEHKSDIQRLISYVARPLETSVLILRDRSVNRSLKASKQLLSLIPPTTCNPLSNRDLRHWIERQKDSRPFTPDALSLFIKHCSNGRSDLGVIASEIRKLNSFADGRPVIHWDMVNSLVRPLSDFSLFDLSGPIRRGEVSRALNTLHSMLTDGVVDSRSKKRIRNPQTIALTTIGSLGKYLRDLWRAHSLLATGQRYDEVRVALGRVYRPHDIIREARETRVSTLSTWHAALCQADQKLKSGIPALDILTELILLFAGVPAKN
ncbi:MAG: DNA polymerase III subunit delta [Planctomycetota bacterium]|nr:DNA polymerase III subunit delta [Planctomycetota bacterium]